jgi:very-short-patch-repair endonuclease
MPSPYCTTSKTLERARRLRREMTDAEKKLWRHIRADQLEGHSFRKQVPAKPYILDFCCLRKKLVVELDGGQH